MATEPKLTALPKATIFVANDYDVTAYRAAGSDGDVAPAATIAGADTGLAGPDGLAVDSSGNIYVSNGYGGPAGSGTVSVYAAAVGPVGP